MNRADEILKGARHFRDNRKLGVVLEARTKRAEQYFGQAGRSISGLSEEEMAALRDAGLNLAHPRMLTGRYRTHCYFDGAVLKAEGKKMVCSDPSCRLSYFFTEEN